VDPRATIWYGHKRLLRRGGEKETCVVNVVGLVGHLNRDRVHNQLEVPLQLLHPALSHPELDVRVDGELGDVKSVTNEQPERGSLTLMLRYASLHRLDVSIGLISTGS
jgi:hypothetical protein